METYQLLFPLIMILSPAVVTLFFKTVPKTGDDREDQSSQVRKLNLTLWACTLLAAGFHVLNVTRLHWIPVQLTWLLFFPLWFGLAMPLLNHKNPGFFQCVAPVSRQRSASLAPRLGVLPTPWIVWAWAGWAVLMMSAVALGMRTLPNATQLWFLFFHAAGAFMLGGMLWSARTSVYEPEPMDARGSHELALAYERLRLMKVRMFFWFGVAGMLVFELPCLLIAIDPQRMLIPAIVVGAGGGTLLGIFGSVFGTLVSRRRMEIHGLLNQLTRA